MTIDEPRNTGCRSQKSFLPMDDESQTIVIPRHSKILFKSFDNNNFAKKLFHPPTGLCNVQKWTESGGNSTSLSLSLSFLLSLTPTNAKSLSVFLRRRLSSQNPIFYFNVHVSNLCYLPGCLSFASLFFLGFFVYKMLPS